jgi:hypothetical protein
MSSGMLGNIRMLRGLWYVRRRQKTIAPGPWCIAALKPSIRNFAVAAPCALQYCIGAVRIVRTAHVHRLITQMQANVTRIRTPLAAMQRQ